MKTITRLATLLITALVLMVSLCAGETDVKASEKGMVIYTAADLVKEYNNGRIEAKKLIVSEVYDDTGYYLRAKADSTRNNVLCWTLSSSFELEQLDTVVIGFRTNYTANQGNSKYFALEFSKDSTFNWEAAYHTFRYDRSSMILKDGIVTDTIVASGLKATLEGKGATEISYIKLSPWSGQELGTSENIYVDIEYVAFFEKSEDAKNFDYKEYSDKNLNFTAHTVTYLDKDGKKIAEEKAIDGSLYSPMTAPIIKYYNFINWTYRDGTVVPENITVNGDITLMANYSFDEALYLKEAREIMIKEAFAKGLERTDKSFIAGYEGFEFRPENNMTRAEACTVVARLVADENTLDNNMTTAFTDISKDAWYYKYVTHLESIGYLKSYSGEFKPNQNITRAEFVELVYNMGKIKDGNKEVSFKDVPADHPRYDVIMAAAKAGLVNGKTADTFDPDGNIKRSEVVKVLCIALGRNPDKNSFTEVVVAGFTDISTSHWAYPYVMAAAYDHKSIVGNNGEEIWTSVNDTNDYLTAAPDGLVEKLDKMFADRVESIKNSKSEWTVAEGGTVWYFSYSEGENINDGKSPKTPFKTIAKLDRMQKNREIKAGDVVLFKRGDEWHDTIECIEGVTYSAYGEGPKPRILASIEADTADKWLETDVPGVYVYRNNIEVAKDVGNIIFNEGECFGFRILSEPKTGNILAAGNDNLVGNGIKTWKNDNRHFDSYKTLAEYANDIPDSDLMYYHDHETKKLYLYSRDGNPGERFDSVEIATRGHAITATSNVIIDNLCIKYTGSHGISSGTCENLTVRNCEIGIVGGSIQNPNDKTSTVRYGNSAQIYGGADGFYVYNNYMYGAFDCGPTVQWQGDLQKGEVFVEKNIEFYGNALDGASLEVWLTTNNIATDDTYAILENCRIYDNYVTGSGSGWKAYNHQKSEWCAYYGGSQTNAIYRDCYMEDNYFWNNKRHLMKAVPTTTKDDLGFAWINNTIVHPIDEGSIGYLGSNSVDAKAPAVQYFYDKDTINTLVKNGTFGLNKFYYTPGNKENKRIAKGIYA